MRDLPGAEGGPGRRPSGELEASVLAALWAAEGRALTAADVQHDLGTDLARTTVTTILARLHEKGSVSRTRAGRGYAYLPVQDSPGLAARRMRTELDKSGSDDRGMVLARFVSGLDASDEALLRALLGEAEADDSAGPVAEPGSGSAAGSGSGAGSSAGSGSAAAWSGASSGPGAGSWAGSVAGGDPAGAVGPSGSDAVRGVALPGDASTAGPTAGKRSAEGAGADSTAPGQGTPGSGGGGA